MLKPQNVRTYFMTLLRGEGRLGTTKVELTWLAKRFSGPTALMVGMQPVILGHPLDVYDGYGHPVPTVVGYGRW